MAGEYPYIARQGWPLVLAAVALALVLHFALGGAWSVPAWLLAGLFLYLFRDPERRIPPAPLAVVSPADGEVTAVTDCRDPYLAREARRVDLRMSPWGVYTTRSPVEGKIMEIWFQEAGQTREEARNGAHYAIWVQTDERDDVVLEVQVQARRLRPRCYVHIGERIGQGQRCGIMGFGGRLSLYVPAGSRIEVAAGAQVRAGSDVLATLVH